MKHLLTAVLCAGTLLFAGCGGVEESPALEAQEQDVVQCRAGQYTRTTYYSDAAKTVEVGHRICGCTGVVTTYGQTSAYFSVSTALCN
jgi:hypothetical protein